MIIVMSCNFYFLRDQVNIALQQIVMYLLEKGADPHIKDLEGRYLSVYYTIQKEPHQIDKMLSVFWSIQLYHTTDNSILLSCEKCMLHVSQRPGHMRLSQFAEYGNCAYTHKFFSYIMITCLHPKLCHITKFLLLSI